MRPWSRKYTSLLSGENCASPLLPAVDVSCRAVAGSLLSSSSG
ncbi:MAG: hypothetical protein WKG07_26295 [Hymenobacter sp.]